ncbi:MAG TPA: penicillin acylase family protein [Blastococcus sp.]
MTDSPVALDLARSVQVDYMRATNRDEFLAAMNRWGTPPENQLFADPAGNIGWKPAGLTPIRPGWNGTLPVPGDGRPSAPDR